MIRVQDPQRRGSQRQKQREPDKEGTKQVWAMVGSKENAQRLDAARERMCVPGRPWASAC